MVMKYSEGDKVILGEFEGIPRQNAVVLSGEELSWGISYVVQVEPEGDSDDGLRELTEDQIEGYQLDG